MDVKTARWYAKDNLQSSPELRLIRTQQVRAQGEDGEEDLFKVAAACWNDFMSSLVARKDIIAQTKHKKTDNI